MDIQIGNPTAIWLISIAIAGLILAAVALVARRRAAARFASSALRPAIWPARSTSRHWLSAILVCASMFFMTLALLDLRWGKTTREVPQKGIEVVFALDVSRSMLAQDVTPNRLDRAKQQISDMVDEMAGDRVGLVVFAGNAKQVLPLTSHYEDFKQILADVGPHSVTRGGSRLGDAIQVAADCFMNKTNEHKTIVLFTDGEDQESRPVELAEDLNRDMAVRIFTVGLGDMDAGARVPDSGSGRNDYLKYQGETVWSKLNGKVLRSIASQTGAAYIPAGTKQVNMANVYRRFVANVPQTEFETAKINAYEPRFQWFASVAAILLVLEITISTRAGRAHQLRPSAVSVPVQTAIDRQSANWERAA